MAGPNRLCNFIKICAGAKHIEACWESLRANLDDFGFDRLLFASKGGANKSNLHNLFGTYILSSYGEAVDQLFITNRAFVEDFTVNWLLENIGAVSWQVNRDRYLQGNMTKSETQIHLATREIGLVNGYSYTSTPPDTGYAAGFGLCAKTYITQAEVDETWRLNGALIEALLDVFLINFRRIPTARQHEILDFETLKILEQIYLGKTNTEIAELLGYHRRTVEQRLSEARRKLDVSNTAQLVGKLVEQAQLF